MIKTSYFLVFILLLTVLLSSDHNNREIEFPDIPGSKTLVCDLHMHTVFSDGSVWPNIRVQEAQKDGVDFISTTEHLEYQPWKDDIPHPNRNRAYQVAKQYSSNTDVIVINGSEITRNMPPGHANAIFIKDANKLLVKDPIEAFRAAKEQDAFIFWNHPNWTNQSPDGSVPLSQMHKNLIKDDLLHGIEVVNDTTYSDEAFQVALDYNLTILGTSDIHDLIDWQYRVYAGGHRPVTLVFAFEKTNESLKRALKLGKTVVWFNQKLIGKVENLIPLINASLKVETAHYLENTTIAHVVIKNHSDAMYTLRNQSTYVFHNTTDLIIINPHSTMILDVRTLKKKKKFELQFEVLNALSAPSSHPIVRIQVSPKT